LGSARATLISLFELVDDLSRRVSGRLVPDYKTIADFGKDNGEAICKVYAQFIMDLSLDAARPLAPR
jgi:hypothetical protein